MVGEAGQVIIQQDSTKVKRLPYGIRRTEKECDRIAVTLQLEQIAAAQGIVNAAIKRVGYTQQRLNTQ